jgi:hypothetical protein
MFTKILDVNKSPGLGLKILDFSQILDVLNMSLPHVTNISYSGQFFQTLKKPTLRLSIAVWTFYHVYKNVKQNVKQNVISVDKGKRL